MILRRYGTSYHSVTPNFNPTAMSEVGFQRDREFSIGAEEFEERYTVVSRSELGSEAEGFVQNEAEQAVLDELLAQMRTVLAGLGPNQVLVIENGREDYPKMRERRESRPVDGDTKFHFRRWVEPPLKVAVYAPS